VDIKESLRKHRIEKGLGQEQLGYLLGVSAAMISQWERGERNPKNETLQKIADALEVSLSDLLRQTIPKEENKMNEQEILRQQLELLAERSKKCDDYYLAEITRQMMSIATYLSSNEAKVA
jgi:transcriptional regulator with XRE-family HTH domain